MKKILLSLTVCAQLSMAQSYEKSWFAGVSFDAQKNYASYNQSLHSVDDSVWVYPLSAQAGFYFQNMRAYVSMKYTYDIFSEYNLDTVTTFANVDYIPKVFNAFGYDFSMILGVGAGMTQCTMSHRSATVKAFQSAINPVLSQMRPSYKYRVGGIYHLNKAIQLEGSLEFQAANILEFPDTSTPVTLFYNTKEIHLSANYLFGY